MPANVVLLDFNVTLLLVFPVDGAAPISDDVAAVLASEMPKDRAGATLRP